MPGNEPAHPAVGVNVNEGQGSGVEMPAGENDVPAPRRVYIVKSDSADKWCNAKMPRMPSSSRKQTSAKPLGSVQKENGGKA